MIEDDRCPVTLVGINFRVAKRYVDEARVRAAERLTS